MMKLGAVYLVRTRNESRAFLGQNQARFILVRIREAQNPSQAIPSAVVESWGQYDATAETSDYKGEAELYLPRGESFDQLILDVSANGFNSFKTPPFSLGEGEDLGITVLLAKEGETTPGAQLIVGLPSPSTQPSSGSVPTDDFLGVPTWGWIAGGIGTVGLIALATRKR